jgi:hypothetical protein
LSVVEVEMVCKDMQRWMKMLGRGKSGVEGQAELYEVGEKAARAQARDAGTMVGEETVPVQKSGWIGC